jgi:hypothetical protein
VSGSYSDARGRPHVLHRDQVRAAASAGWRNNWRTAIKNLQIGTFEVLSKTVIGR